MIAEDIQQMPCQVEQSTMPPDKPASSRFVLQNLLALNAKVDCTASMATYSPEFSESLFREYEQP